MFPTVIIVSHMKVNMNFHLNNNLDKTLTFIQPYTYDFDLHITKYMWYCLLLRGVIKKFVDCLYKIETP